MLVVGDGLDWTLGSEIVDIGLKMRLAEAGLDFSRFGASKSR